MKLLLLFIGAFLIMLACDYKRKEDSKIRIFTKDWFLVILLLSIGVYLMHFNYD